MVKLQMLNSNCEQMSCKKRKRLCTKNVSHLTARLSAAQHKVLIAAVELLGFSQICGPIGKNERIDLID